MGVSKTERHLRVMNRECVRCGRRLDPNEDMDWYTGNYMKTCMICRCRKKAARDYPEDKRDEVIERLLGDRTRMRRYMRMCISCGRPLQSRNTGDRCIVCTELDARPEERTEKVHRIERCYNLCQGCQWKMYHGDHWSCPSPAGTNPVDGNCLLFERKRLLAEEDER